jgi:hypothetical protein
VDLGDAKSREQVKDPESKKFLDALSGLSIKLDDISSEKNKGMELNEIIAKQLRALLQQKGLSTVDDGDDDDENKKL